MKKKMILMLLTLRGKWWAQQRVLEIMKMLMGLILKVVVLIIMFILKVKQSLQQRIMELIEMLMGMESA